MKSRVFKVVVPNVTAAEAQKIADIDLDGFSGWRHDDAAFISTWTVDVRNGAKDSDIQQELADDIAHELGRNADVTFDDVAYRTGRVAPSDKMVDRNPLEGLIVTRGSSDDKERILRVSGSRDVFGTVDGKVGTVLTAFHEFEGTPAQVRDWLREYALGGVRSFSANR